MKTIARGPKVPANGFTAPWRTVLVEQDRNGNSELVVYAEYYRQAGTELTHGIYYGKDDWRGAIECFTKQVRRDVKRILTVGTNS